MSPISVRLSSTLAVGSVIVLPVLASPAASAASAASESAAPTLESSAPAPWADSISDDHPDRGVLLTRGDIGTGVWYERGIAISPRLQWNSNSGYCGETSFISAGMYYGQYTSQWTARQLASPGVPQTNPASQLLLGRNDLAAARLMRLQVTRFAGASQRSTPQFLAWVKRQFVAGNVPIIGVFNNLRMLDEPLRDGQPDYDHIVPVLGIGSQHRLDRNAGTYFPTDNITISDNGLANVGPNRAYLYSYRFDWFPLTRNQANTPGGALYSILNTPRNYGTSVSGVLDPDRATIPVRLTSNVNGEGLLNKRRVSTPPPPIQLQLTATVKIANQNRGYKVYLYDNFAKVPTENFNAAAWKASRVWTIPAHHGPTWTTTIPALSNSTRVFRAVPNSAP